MPYAKRSQMKMLETILVLLVFFFLLVFGLIFYVGFSSRQKGMDYEEEMGSLALQASQRFSSLSEIKCTTGGSYEKVGCMDIYSLEIFSIQADENYDVYRKLFPNTKIEITQIYPSKKHWVVYDDYFNYTGKAPNIEKFYMPIALHNTTADLRNLGFVTIGVYYG